MSDQTTTPDASGDAGQPDYAAKYNGLQAAFQKRTNEFASKEQAWETEKADYEAKVAKLAEYEAREQADQEEAAAQRQYEALRERFAPQSPAPMRHNEARGSAGSRDDGSAEYLRNRLQLESGERQGWPV